MCFQQAAKSGLPSCDFLTVTAQLLNMSGLLSPANGRDTEDRVSLISIKSVNPSPDTLTSKYFKA